MNIHFENEIKILIDEKRFNDADIRLDSVVENERCARWNYMKGVTLTGKGWHHDAHRYLENAHFLEPENAEYKSALKALSKGKDMEKYFANHAEGGNGKKGHSICDCCEICHDLGQCCECISDIADCF